MGDIINLNRHRKRKARAGEERCAQQNRERFGRTKAEKTFTQRQQEKNRLFLEVNRLERQNDSIACDNSQRNQLEQGDDT